VSVGPRWQLDVQIQAGDFSLCVQTGVNARVLALFGPSGAGKSTLVECLARIRRFTGSVRIDGRPLPALRVGWVPQDAALFPHRTVEQNIDHARRPGSMRQRAVEVLGLTGLLKRRPAGLSGGEQQRVALARALASAPDLLLLDEPLSGVDLARRARAFGFLQEVRAAFDVPILYVSHDPAEVRAIADRVICLDEGRVKAEGTPDETLANAMTLRLLDRLTLDNVLAVRWTEGEGTQTAGGSQIRVPGSRRAGSGRGWIGARAEDVMLACERPTGLSARNRWPGRVTALTGGASGVRVAVDAGDRWVARVTPAAVAELGLEVGAEVWVIVKTHSLVWLPD